MTTQPYQATEERKHLTTGGPGKEQGTNKVSKSKSLNPSFLSMFIRRTEFDRYARFHSWGSARETFTWDDLKEVKIPIPSIDIQNSIVDIYNSFILRRKINDKLRAQIQNICPILVSGSIKEVQTDAEI